MYAYYFDNQPGDQRLPHHDSESSRSVDTEILSSIKVESWNIPVDEWYEEKLDAIAKERAYKNRDVITLSKENLGEDFEEKIKVFYKEHIHEDDEIRYILSGGGFFDVRQASTNAWIRLAVSPGDLLVIPAGIYHRFTVNEGNMAQAVRLFKDEPKWMAIYRGEESDANPHRIRYLKSIAVDA
ncbi:Acireductone dioxygenase ARD family [Lentinula lateritia]|uniref:Acireductone dioxygenase ARD family n=1 Tax=Lentinula aff. lateritia TaxID=2804960 RepID=A0ACC1UA00_9AGAR|nr:Acireductone dioxygenase ARD family [Lentinula aff. lateritia]KAJ3851035.1 Acireductone dioxygenase ARD family [Lentinula lateritia]